jgi:hypothetical protein
LMATMKTSQESMEALAARTFTGIWKIGVKALWRDWPLCK